MKVNAKNERIKRAYVHYLREAKRQSEPSVDAVAAALDRFETYTKRRDFAAFHIEQATAFKAHLAAQLNPKTGRPLSQATRLQILSALRAFFIWLADQPGYRKRIRYCDADYFNLSHKETAIARADRGTSGPTLEQVRHVLAQMLVDSDIARRNRALIACAILTGARDAALASLRLKHVDLREGRILQDAREVRTKASKTITTYFFAVGDDIRAILDDWVRFLVEEKLWGPDDPLFPKTRIEVGPDGAFGPTGLERAGWRHASPIRRIFREAFEAAGLPYFNPHSFRHTLVRLGQERCTTPEQFKAWSQNLGHEKVMTTFSSYGQVDRHRQGEIIRSLTRTGAGASANGEDQLLREFEEFRRSRRATG